MARDRCALGGGAISNILKLEFVREWCVWSVLEVFYGRSEVLGGWGFGSGLVEVRVVGDWNFFLIFLIFILQFLFLILFQTLKIFLKNTRLFMMPNQK